MYVGWTFLSSSFQPVFFNRFSNYFRLVSFPFFNLCNNKNKQTRLSALVLVQDYPGEQQLVSTQTAQYLSKLVIRFPFIKFS